MSKGFSKITAEDRVGLILYVNSGYFDGERIIKMEKIAEGISDFGDFKAILFKTSDGRHFLRFEPSSGLEKPCIQWLPGNDYLEWLRCLAYNQHC